MSSPNQKKASNAFRFLRLRNLTSIKPLNEAVGMQLFRSANMTIKMMALLLVDPNAVLFEEPDTALILARIGNVDYDTQTLFSILAPYSRENLIDLFGEGFADYIGSDLVSNITDPDEFQLYPETIQMAYQQWSPLFNPIWAL